MLLHSKIYCIGRRRLAPSWDADQILLHLTLERGDREDHLAHLRMEPSEAKKLQKSLGVLLKGHASRGR